LRANADLGDNLAVQPCKKSCKARGIAANSLLTKNGSSGKTWCVTFMRKATKTFEQSRKALLARMSARSGRTVIRKIIPFRNDDVSRYLRELDKFERQSRSANLVVGLHQSAIAG
jgi:hypothetical protein